ncbi:MAG TPA: NAD(P)/FAD-dependent oxidoreductase [Acidimicrobiales bacterium]|nr:NAD(P)/FAD-dependent oxidoreductase [Acidimicrobiales bacterium]
MAQRAGTSRSIARKVGGNRPRVVIVGAGFGGISTAKALAKMPVEVTLVDRQNYHGFWPLLYQVATAGLAPDDIAYNVRGIFRDQANASVRLATVTGIDLDARLVHLDPGASLAYDYLVLATGSTNNDYGVPGVAEHAFPLKSLTDALALRNHLLGVFEAAQNDPRLHDAGALTTVVAGGGPTGVEVSGALVELFAVLDGDFKGLDVGRARVVLVEMADHLLPGFAESSQAEALRTLGARRVDVRLETAIAEVGADGVTLSDGSFVATRTLVWAAGVRANPLVDGLGLAQSRGGRLVVEEDLSVPGRPEVFAIGDVAAAGAERSRDGTPYPQLAPVAMQAGRHVAQTIDRRGHGLPGQPFRYRDKGKMATIGRRAAVAELPYGIRFGGTPGWLAWLGLHLVFLVGFRNRAAVLLSWAWNYVTWDRGHRVILSVDTPRRELDR